MRNKQSIRPSGMISLWRYALIAAAIAGFAVMLAAAFAPTRAFADEPVKEGALYRIVNVANPQVCVELNADYPSTGTGAKVAALDPDSTQVFTFAKASDGSYYIRSAYNPALLLTADSLSYRGAVSSRYLTSGKAQTWKLVQQSDGTYHIVSIANTAYMLDTNGSYPVDQAACIMWTDNGGKTQKWRLEEIRASDVARMPGLPDSSDGATYALVNVANANVAVSADSASPAAGAKVQVATYSGAAEQAFSFILQPNGTYKLRSVANPDLYLTADSLSYRGAVSLRASTGNANQSWILAKLSDGTFHVVSLAGTAYMLDTNGSYPNPGAACIMWQNNNGTTQKWTIRQVDAGGQGSQGGTEPDPNTGSGDEPDPNTGSGDDPDPNTGSGDDPDPNTGGNDPDPNTGGDEPDPTPDPTAFLPDSSDGTLYRIVNVANPQVAVQLDSASPADGVKAVVAAKSTAATQLFKITVSNGVYTITSSANDKLVLTAASLSYRGAVTGATVKSGAAQGWRLDLLDDTGTFNIVNTSNTYYMLDTNGSYPSIGAACIMWANNGGDTQKWTFEAVEPEPETPYVVPAGWPDSSDGTLYRIVSVSNPKVAIQFEAAESAAFLKMAAISDSMLQLFRFEVDGDGNYVIRSAANEDIYITCGALQLRGAVFGYALDGGKRQTWTVEQSGSGRFHIVSTGTGYMLDTSGSTTQAGADVIMWTDNSGNTQRWTFQAVSPADQPDPNTGGSAEPNPNTGGDEPETPVTPVATKYYRIVNVANPQVAVELKADYPVSGTGVKVATLDVDSTQIFTIAEKGDGSVYIRSAYNPSLLLTADSLSYRGAVSSRYITSGKAQTWKLIQQSDGTYHIVSTANAAYMLDTNGSYPTNGADCIMWTDNGGTTQKWRLVEVPASDVVRMLSLPDSADGSVYRIKSVSNTSVVVQLASQEPKAGVGVNMARVDDGAYQAFTFELQPDGTYLIRSYANDALVLTADSLSMRGAVSGRAVSGSTSQRWIIERADGSGHFHILSVGNTSYMLDTSGSTTSVGSTCIMWTDNGGNTQKWTFAKVDPLSLSAYGSGNAGGSGNGSGSGTGTAPTPTDPVYTYLPMYEISVADMIRFQKTNAWYNSSTQANDLVYAVNPDNFDTDDPRFYQFLKLDSGYSGVTAEELDAFIAHTASGRSGNLAGMGYAFVLAAQTYGVNEVYLLAHAIHESGWGNSTLASGYEYDGTTQVAGKTWPAGTYYNFYGIGAVDSGPISGGRALAIREGWDSPEKAILGAAKWIKEHYIDATSGNSHFAQNTLYEMRWHSPYSNANKVRSNHQYATGTSWAYRIADIMDDCYSYVGKTPANAVYLIPTYSPSVWWRNADDWRDPDGYVMQWAELVTYSYDQISELTDEELFIARNEMFYCHGYDFDGQNGAPNDPELQEYFEAKTWPRELTGVDWTADELANLTTIEQIEAERGSVYKDRGYHKSDIA